MDINYPDVKVKLRAKLKAIGAFSDGTRFNKFD